MNAITLLDEQHDEVDALFERIERADGARKKAIFDELADLLAIHATIEEKMFYPAAEAKQTDDILLESVEEHLAIKRLVADLLGMSPSDRNFDAKCSVLKEQVQHHVREERTELFPKARKLLDAEQLDALGQEMYANTESLKGMRPRMNVPQETKTAATLPSPHAP